MQQRILHIDLGKNKSAFCDDDPATEQHTFGALTTPADLHGLLAGRPANWW